MAVNEVEFGTYGETVKNICYIIEKETEDLMVYGIRVKNIFNERSIMGLFEKREEVEKFAKTLIVNDVSPLHLFEIADDYVGSII